MHINDEGNGPIIYHVKLISSELIEHCWVISVKCNMFLKVKEIIKFAKVQKSSSFTATKNFIGRPINVIITVARVFRFCPKDEE